jgi:hypothetical protein
VIAPDKLAERLSGRGHWFKAQRSQSLLDVGAIEDGLDRTVKATGNGCRHGGRRDQADPGFCFGRGIARLGDRLDVRQLGVTPATGDDEGLDRTSAHLGDHDRRRVDEKLNISPHQGSQALGSRLVHSRTRSASLRPYNLLNEADEGADLRPPAGDLDRQNADRGAHRPVVSLAISRPVVSKTIADLEGTLGVRLAARPMSSADS